MRGPRISVRSRRAGSTRWLRINLLPTPRRSVEAWTQIS